MKKSILWKQFRRARGNTAGFTLVEVLLVLLILMMLATVLVVYVIPQKKGAEINTTKLLLREIQNALDTYRLNVGHYPTEDEGGLNALLVKPQFENEEMASRWMGPYLRPGTKLVDAWGHPIVYEPVDTSMMGEQDSSSLPYKLYSVGPDGQPDTEDDISLVSEESQTGTMGVGTTTTTP